MKTIIPCGQCHEVDVARMVIICGPGMGKMMGALHPAGSLYERPTNNVEVEKEYKCFREMMEENGVKVFDVREILAQDCNKSVGARLELEDMAAKSLTYAYDETATDIMPDKQTLHYVGEEYKRSVIEEMSEGQLVNIILTRPTVTLKKSYRDTGFTASYSFEPLSNINFTRDQQITTRNGIVMGRLRSEQRRGEVDVLEFCHRKLGLRVIGRIPGPDCYLEGGDFFPAGPDLCMVGIGPRSNLGAVKYMMENDLLGTSRVAVVKDLFEQSQDRMHLDTVFNILHSDCCLMLSEMMGEDSPTRRLVDVYSRADGAEYKLTREDVEFSKFIREEGYNIIPISGEDQLKYGCNVVNLGEGRIISVHKKTARDISKSEYFSGSIQYLNFSSVTAMYGAVHCASQVVVRGDPLPNVISAGLGQQFSKMVLENGSTATDSETNGNGSGLVPESL
uniref:Arginine deiminase n=2 Tax=Timspurckia oligopyrenoides TaxID=708627 RepID=A0A7S0ZC49_9RHOD|mmetsp:Transcript_12030/g.21771  ORF Transcript_12030/g.21771 Transcript_12030/m.21771 type:complete len:449 (+) Transcript_12030:80-1426(+)